MGENSADKEKDLQNTVVELNNLLKEKDNDILQLGKKIMKVENGLDDATEALAASTLAIEEAEKQQLVNEEEVSALQRRCSLLDDDCARSDGRLQVESTKLAEAAADAEAVEIKRKLLEAKNMVNEERIDSLEGQIATASEAEAKIQELEEQLNIVGQNMKTLELSETNALKRHEEFEEKIRDLILNLKFTEIQAAAAEREAAKLQQELDALVSELSEWKDKYQEICVELEQTFNEMAGY